MSYSTSIVYLETGTNSMSGMMPDTIKLGQDELVNAMYLAGIQSSDFGILTRVK